MAALTVRQTHEFRAWLGNLRDRRAAQRIADRLLRLAEGNLGDTKSIGGGLNELRFAFGPGYRIYYTRFGDTLVILLCGGDKSTQSRDIDQAKRLLAAGGWK